MQDLTLFKNAVNNLDFSGLDPLELPPPAASDEPIIIVVMPRAANEIDVELLKARIILLVLAFSPFVGIGSMWLITFIVRWLQTNT